MKKSIMFDAASTAKGSPRAAAFSMTLFLFLGTTTFLFLLMLHDYNRSMAISNGYESALLTPFRWRSLEIKKDKNSHSTYNSTADIHKHGINQIQSSIVSGARMSVKDDASAEIIASEYSNLQSNSYIDRTIEKNARKIEVPDKCSRILLHLPDMFAHNGHGSQLHNYIKSAIISPYLDRAMVLIEPPLKDYKYDGGSQFGCPTDAFQDSTKHESPPSIQGKLVDESNLKEDFPMGFSRLVRHPHWLSNGCPVPCTDTYSYDDWLALAMQGEDLNEVTCTNSDGSQANVVASAHNLRKKYFTAHKSQFVRRDRDDAMSQATKWLGATPQEAEIFADINQENLNDRDLKLFTWNYLMGLMNKAGFLQFQPWIARDVKQLLKSFDLPIDQDYTAIHVRRGDKLISEARPFVQRYWKLLGYKDPDNQPTNYVPFAAYLQKWDGKDKCPVDADGKVQVVKHNVYIATDDPVVVRQEIAALPGCLDGYGADRPTVLWNECHELRFYFNPTKATSFHLYGDSGPVGDISQVFKKEGMADNCFARYHRSITSIADMMLLAKSKTFIGDGNSNWGRLVREMRVQLNPQSGWRAGSGTDNPMDLTNIVDTRIRWGWSFEAGIPGT